MVGEEVIDLLHQYRKSRSDLRKMYNALNDTEKDKEDKTVINSMIDDVTFIIDWIERGSNPDDYRGNNVKNAYHVSKLSNIDILPDITDQLENEPRKLTDEEKRIIQKLFNSWSDRERDCFIFYEVEKRSMAEIARLIGVSKSSVQQYIKRAREKINKII